jgi:hypothetical protein
MARVLQAAIRAATSLEEVARLERVLRSGAVPDAPGTNGTDTAVADVDMEDEEGA